VRTDATNLVFENGSESNNYVAATKILTVTPIPYADLTITNLIASSVANSGQILTASWQVNNQGIGATNNENIYEEVNLTSDPQGKIVVAKLGAFRQVGGLGVGDNYQRNQDLLVPDRLSGTYYLVVNVSGAFELDKTDNNTSISAPIHIDLSPSPDLVVSQITAPTNLQAGDKIDVSWQVTNNGIVDANGKWIDNVYLQALNTTDAPLISLGSFTYNNNLQAGKFYTRTELLTIPSTLQGQYQIVVKANVTGSLYEPQVSNNTSTSNAIGIVYPPRPDLQVANIIVPNTVNAGGTVSVSFEIKNQGTATTKVGQWTDKVYLSLDDKISSDDILIGSFENGLTLNPGQSYVTTTDNAIVPKLFRDTAHIIVITDTDYQVDEGANEGNNIQIKQINVNSVKPADLVTSDVVAPSQAFSGSTVEVRYRVTNKGLAETNAENWTDTIWLSKTKLRPQPIAFNSDGNLSPEDIKLIEINHTGSLKVGESYEVIAKVAIPKNLSGQYYLTPWSDNYDVVLEDTFEINNNPDDQTQIDNNNYKAAPITLLTTPVLRSDLAVTSVISPLTGISGSNTPFTVTWQVTNQGVISTQATSWTDIVYLSTTPNLSDNNWRLLGEVTHNGNLGVGENYQGQLSTTLNPGVAGTYVIVVTKSTEMTRTCSIIPSVPQQMSHRSPQPI
jgi:CARDB